MTLYEIGHRRLTVALGWLAMAVVGTYLFLFEPGKSGFFPDCLFRVMTGFTCPGCGTTRGLHHLLHGDVVEAFQFSPLMMLFLPFLLFAFTRHTNAIMRGRAVRTYQLNSKYLWVLFVVIVSFWIFRNTPWYPFVS